MKSRAAFTLLEVLVTSAILVVLCGVLLGMADQTQRLWRGTTAKVEQFREARTGFEAMTRRLAQATLNTYWDYRFPDNDRTKPPSGYTRASELRFRSGPMLDFAMDSGPNKAFRPTHGVFFQAPSGIVADRAARGALDSLLNTSGYFVELGDDRASLPAFLRESGTARKRYALMELLEPSEQLSVYDPPIPMVADWWFKKTISADSRPVRALARNVVALALLPRLARADEEARRRRGVPTLLAPAFRYDSTQSAKDAELNPLHQLPPVIQVVMVALDEPSARRLAEEHDESPTLGIEFGKLFTDPAKLDDDPATTAPGDGDTAKLESTLRKLNAMSRTFSTTVILRGAKWSREQSL